MRPLSLAIIALTALSVPTLSVPAFAQATKPSAKVMFGKAQTDAVLSGDLIGLTVVNGNKDNVGEIKDLVIDNGKLAGYVLSVGGFLGMGEHYVEVKPESVAVNYDTADKKWKALINTNKDELKAAPEFAYTDRMKH